MEVIEASMLKPRQTPRVRVLLPMELEGGLIKCLIKDASVDGFGFQTWHDLEEGTFYPFRLRLPSSVSILGRLRICWKKGHTGHHPWEYGASVTLAGAESRRTLDKFLLGSDNAKPVLDFEAVDGWVGWLMERSPVLGFAAVIGAPLAVLLLLHHLVAAIF